MKIATADEALTGGPADAPDDPSFIFAEEIRSLEFRYWDGTTWQQTWDGTTPTGSASAPIGPPMAVEIKIGIIPPGLRRQSSGMSLDAPEQTLKYYRHVVAIPTANGPTTPSTNSTPGQ
jgi:hypothetical protein